MHRAPPNDPQSQWSRSTFSVSGEGDEKEQASDLKSTQFLDLPLKTLLMGPESASLSS